MRKTNLLLICLSIFLVGCGQVSDKIPTVSENIAISSNEIISVSEDIVIIKEENIEETTVSDNEIIIEEQKEEVIIEPVENIESEPVIMPTPIIEQIPVIEPEPTPVIVVTPSADIPDPDWTDYGNSDSHILILGDSRLVALCGYTDIEQRYKVIAQGGANSTWIGETSNWTFRNDNSRINTFNDTMCGTVSLSAEVLQEYGVDTIVYMIGVNDITCQINWGHNALNSINNAITALKSTGCKVIFNNIGYVRPGSGYEGADLITNELVDSFNNSISGYDAKINCFAGLPNSYNCDGLHYAPEEQQGILNLLTSYIGY